MAGVIQTLDARYIDGAKLVTLLRGLFGQGNFKIDVRLQQERKSVTDKTPFQRIDDSYTLRIPNRITRVNVTLLDVHHYLTLRCSGARTFRPQGRQPICPRECELKLVGERAGREETLGESELMRYTKSLDVATCKFVHYIPLEVDGGI